MDEIEKLKKRIAELENENIIMYSAILEASTLGSNAYLRCEVELQRIAKNDAAHLLAEITDRTTEGE